MIPFDERFYLSQDGLQLYYRDYRGPPDRTPVLCIPGLTRNARDFDFIAGHIAAKRRVLVADLRGRGRSAYDPDPRNYAVPAETGDMLRLLDAVGIARAVVLGTSRGGVIAMTMAAAPLAGWPERSSTTWALSSKRRVSNHLRGHAVAALLRRMGRGGRRAQTRQYCVVPECERQALGGIRARALSRRGGPRRGGLRSEVSRGHSGRTRYEPAGCENGGGRSVEVVRSTEREFLRWCCAGRIRRYCRLRHSAR